MSRTDINQVKRKRIFDRDNGECQICGKKLVFEVTKTINTFSKNFYTIDHIKPISKGGKNNEENLRLLCKSCNCSKHNREADDFIRVVSSNTLKALDNGFNDKELIIKDYIRQGQKEILMQGLQKLIVNINSQLNKDIELINKLEGELNESQL